MRKWFIYLDVGETRFYLGPGITVRGEQTLTWPTDIESKRLVFDCKLDALDFRDCFKGGYYYNIGSFIDGE